MDKINLILNLGVFYFFCINLNGILSQKHGSNTTCKGAEACVYSHIFNGYNKLTRPTKEANTTIRVQLEFVFNGLMDIEEKDEIMRVVGFFRAFWRDELLNWKPEDYGGVESITVPAEEIWLPDIGITNSVSRFYEVTYKRDFHLQILHNGNIRWSFGGILTTSCDIDLMTYPFDHQSCDIVLESWQYRKEHLTLDLYPDMPVNLETAEDDPQWILEEGTAETFLKYEDRFSAVKFTLNWVRKPLYYYVNIIIPGAYIALITLGVFWLPIECGEKMSLGITVVLAFSVFQIVIMEITPVSSDAVPKITEMVIMVMTLATASLLSSMFVSYLSDFDTPPPRWVKRVFLYHIPRVLRMSTYDNYKDEMTGKVNTKGVDANAKTGNTCNTRLLENNHGSGQASPGRNKGQDNALAVDEEENNGEQRLEAGEDLDNLTLEGHSQLAHTKEDVREILSLLHLMKERFSEEEEGKRIREYWKAIGMAIDRVVFWICFIVFGTYLLYSLIKLRVMMHSNH